MLSTVGGVRAIDDGHIVSAITQAQLEDLVMEVLGSRPITAGTVTRNMMMTGVNRPAVKRALDRLVEKKKAGYVVAPCERNGFMVNGKHYFDVELFEQQEWEDDDPFDGLT